MQRSVMFLLSTTSILSCKRWFVNCLTVTFALALSDRIVGVENMVWHWEHFSLMKVFSFSSLFKISLEVQDSALFVPTGQNVPMPNVTKILSLVFYACMYLVYFQLRIRQKRLSCGSFILSRENLHSCKFTLDKYKITGTCNQTKICVRCWI